MHARIDLFFLFLSLSLILVISNCSLKELVVRLSRARAITLFQRSREKRPQVRHGNYVVINYRRVETPARGMCAYEPGCVLSAKFA